MLNAPRIPSYRRHKATGQAVVTLGGRDIYLGRYNSAASRAEYNRVIAEWTAHGGALPKQRTNDLTVTEFVTAFLRYVKGYYRRPNGSLTTELKNFKLAIRRLKAIYGRALDNVFVERLWRSVKYEEVYLKDYAGGWEAEQSLATTSASIATVASTSRSATAHPRKCTARGASHAKGAAFESSLRQTERGTSNGMQCVNSHSGQTTLHLIQRQKLSNDWGPPHPKNAQMAEKAASISDSA